MSNPPPAADLPWTVLKVLQWAAAYLKERAALSALTVLRIAAGER